MEIFPGASESWRTSQHLANTVSTELHPAVLGRVLPVQGAESAASARRRCARDWRRAQEPVSRRLCRPRRASHRDAAQGEEQRKELPKEEELHEAARQGATAGQSTRRKTGLFPGIVPVSTAEPSVWAASSVSSLCGLVSPQVLDVVREDRKTEWVRERAVVLRLPP